MVTIKLIYEEEHPKQNAWLTLGNMNCSRNLHVGQEVKFVFAKQIKMAMSLTVDCNKIRPIVKGTSQIHDNQVQPVGI